MIRIKVWKWTQLIYYALVIVLAVIIIGLAVHAISSRSSAPDGQDDTKAVGIDITVRAEEQVSSAPVFGQAPSRGQADRQIDPVYENIFSAVKGLLSWIPLGSEESGDKIILNPPANNDEIETAAHAATPGEGENEADKTPPPLHIQVQINEILEEYNPEEYTPSAVNDTEVRVALYHTHSREAFEQDAKNAYAETEKWRTADTEYNILKLGALLEKQLNNAGIKTLQDRTDHEPPQHGTAYIRSLVTARRLVSENEGLQLLIDMHRDAYITGEPKYITSNGTNYAQMCFVIGTGEGSNGNTFKEKPNWQENYKLALRLTDEINKLVPGLCKAPSVRTGRYNQHTSESALLVEVGHNENTLDEVKAANEVLGEAIISLLGGT